MEVQVRVDAETVWLTQSQMAELFDTSTDNIGLHLKNIYAEGELAERATTEDSSVVRTEGRRQVRRKVKHYNLDGTVLPSATPVQIMDRRAKAMDAVPANNNNNNNNKKPTSTAQRQWSS